MMDTKFNVAIPVLVPTVLTILDNGEQHLDTLNAYKSKYTTDYFADKRSAIINAQHMPDADARSAAHEVLRLQLVSENKICLHLWQGFKNYCRDAYPDQDLFDIMLSQGGWNYYDAASAQNWPSQEALNVSATNFMTANATVLRTQGFMPDDYADRYQVAAENFANTYSVFRNALQVSKAGTDARNTALSNCYMDTISLCLDAQNLFADNDTVKALFVFDTVSSMIAPAGAAGLKGYATYVINGEPVTGLTAEIENTDKRVTTNPEGFYDFGNLSSGTYTVKYKLGDVVKDTEQVTIPTGTTVTKNVRIV